MRKLYVLLSCMLCVLWTMGISAQATSLEGNSNVTLFFETSDTQEPFVDATFYLHKVGEYESGPVDDLFNYTLVDVFGECQVDLTNLDFHNDTQRLIDLAAELSSHAARSGIEPLLTGATDEEGCLIFTDLTPGLYLVWGEKLPAREGDPAGTTYVPQAVLIPLPYHKENGDSTNSVLIKLKYERIVPPPPTPTPAPTPTPSTGSQVDTKLPQTGQLWWPVPLALIFGMILLGLGVRLRRSEE